MSSIQELNEQIAQLQKQKEQLLKQQRAEVVKRLKAEIAEYGLTSDDLFGNGGGGRRRRTESEIENEIANKLMLAFIANTPAYYNPAKDKVYVSSKGAKPAWLAEKYRLKDMADYQAKKAKAAK
jgi:hypothetical protein